MKSKFKVIGVLMLMGVLAAGLALPYTFSLLGEALNEGRGALGLSEGAYKALIFTQSAVMYVTAALVGGLCYQRAGFRVPILENLLGGSTDRVNMRSWFVWSAGTGILLAGMIISGDYIFYKLGSPLSFFNMALPAWWTGVMAAFSAGIGEELLLRFFLMSVFTLIFLKLFRLPQAAAVWSAMILAAVLFGLLHLPATAGLVELNLMIVTRALLLNGIGAMAFGFLYWKKGLEAAMAAHIVTDLILHGLMPILL